MKKTKRSIGELLVRAGYINQHMLDFSLKVQNSYKSKKMGDILKSLGFASDIEIAKILAKQAKLEYFSLENFHPKVDVLQDISYQIAKKGNILPLYKRDSKTTIAVADPFDSTTQEYLQQFFPDNRKLVVSPLNRLHREIENRYYLVDNSIEDGVKKIQDEIARNDNLQTAKLIEYLNQTAVEFNASDMHISSTDNISFISYRIDGVLQPCYSFPAKIHSRIVSAYKLECAMDITETMIPQDGRGKFEFLGSVYELRISSMPTTNGENIVVRFLSTSQEIKSLEDLGFSKEQEITLKKHLNSPAGVILCTGPTGSGKTTTLYSLIKKTDYLQKNVLTVEDPVEYKIPMIKQVSVNEKAGITFSNAIKSFLRQDPDIILIGEIRDEETAQLAIRAAQTGHLLLSSLHTNDAVGSIARLRDLGVGNYLLATTVSCVVAQRLVRKLCPMCKKKVRVSQKTVDKLELTSDIIYRKQGCEQCFNTGYMGRIAVAEVLELSNKIRSMIDAGESPIALREQAELEGTIPLKQSIRNLVADGITDDKEFERVNYD